MSYQSIQIPDYPIEYEIMFYKVVMMGGVSVRIDPEEYPIVRSGISKGGFIQLKQALINASSISLIEVDRNRVDEHKSEFINKRKLMEVKGEILPWPKTKYLQSVFQDTKTPRIG